MKFGVTVRQELTHDFEIEADNAQKARTVALALVDNWLTDAVVSLSEEHDVMQPYIACTDVTEIVDYDAS